VAERLGIINTTLQRRRREVARCNALADILTALAEGCSVEIETVMTIAESIEEDALQDSPIHFPNTGGLDLPHHVAAHSIAVAQVIARLCRREPEWRANRLEPVAAALVHDVGMVKMPAALVTHDGPLTDEQRRKLETHPILGNDLALKITPT